MILDLLGNRLCGGDGVLQPAKTQDADGNDNRGKNREASHDSFFYGPISHSSEFGRRPYWPVDVNRSGLNPLPHHRTFTLLALAEFVIVGAENDHFNIETPSTRKGVDLVKLTSGSPFGAESYIVPRK